MSAAYFEVVPGICWWCGAPADSREHRLKRSDIVREYGKPPYHGLRTLTRFSGGDRHDFHGPASRLVKFANSLCARCNNARSQPFDQAWDHFTRHLAQHEEAILATRTIDLAAVYGASWEERAADLARYVVKHLICRIVDLPGPVRLDSDLITFLDGGPFPSCLALDVCLDLGVMEMLRLTSQSDSGDPEEAAEAGFLGNAPVWVQQNPQTGEWFEPQAGIHYRWLTVYWKVGAPGDAVDPFQQPQITLSEKDGIFSPAVRELFSILAEVPIAILDDGDLGRAPHEKLRAAGYTDAAARVERLARQIRRETTAPGG
jgi:hypothetical protein